MNAPVVWILIPAVLAIGLFLLRRWERAMHILGLAIVLLLAFLAWQLPIDKAIPLGFGLPDLKLGSTLAVLGRRFVLDDTTRPVLMLVYLSVAFWFGGAYTAHSHRVFIPLGLLVASLLTSALIVQPFLYAALILELVALVCVPILSPPGQPVGRGVLRFLIFQTLGMPFILFTGWILAGVESNPGDLALVARASLLVGLGFAFMASIWPFYTWLPMTAQDAHPYMMAFVFFVFPSVVSLFGLSFFERYAWMRSSSAVYLALGVMGAIMVLVGGSGAAFQRHLGRILGYAMIVEIGFSLLSMALLSGGENQAYLLSIFFAQLLPRVICLALWSLSLVTFQRHTGDLRFRAVSGLARMYPFATAGLVLSNLSLAGFPLLASFPVRMALWTALARQSLILGILALLGSSGLLFAGLRSLAVLVTGPKEESWQLQESRMQITLICIGCALLFLVGMMPQWFLAPFTNVARLFFTPGK